MSNRILVPVLFVSVAMAVVFALVIWWFSGGRP